MLHEERILVDRGPIPPYPMIVGTCEACNRRRMYNTAFGGLATQCYCQHKKMTFEKTEMLLIDKIEPLLLEMDYINPVMQAARGAPNLSYTAAGIDAESGNWVFIDLEKLPLGNNSPTFLYLIAFPDWHGERFVKVGIGI